MASPSRSSANKESENYIGLNVGGKIYCTSRTTLTGGFFDGLLGVVVPASAKDDQGNYLIDRNGDIFRHVLNFLRCGELVVPARFHASHLHLLRQEADFFMLDALKTAVEDKLKWKWIGSDNILEIPSFWSSPVGLNVGGKIYHTSHILLERYYKDSFFSQLHGFSTFPKDDQGNYMIDRDGEIFQHVLEFLVSGKLMLPERFDEFALLKHEADFFLLEPLKEAIGSLEMVGFVINNQVFKLRQKDVLRYEKSLSAKYPKDTQGNYVIEKDLEAVDHVMNYIRYGGIAKDITTDQLELLRKDDKELQLNLFDHCESLEFMKQHWEERCLIYIHVYHWLNGPCIAYINKSPSFFWTRYPTWTRENHAYCSFFHDDMKEIEIGDGKASFAKVALNDGRPTIVSYFDRISDSRQLLGDCTLMKFCEYKPTCRTGL